MAMEIANHIAGVKNAPYRFYSAGIAVFDNDIDDNVKRALEQIDIKATHKPITVESLDIHMFQAIHVMSQRQKITLSAYYRDKGLDIEKKITVLGIENPFSEGIKAYIACRDKFVEFYDMYIK